jgi:DNA-binding GntR family transcriptional regulator
MLVGVRRPRLVYIVPKPGSWQYVIWNASHPGARRTPSRIVDCATCGVWYTKSHVSKQWLDTCEVADTQLKIAPIGEGLSLKARAYEALKAAITNMNIYADDAELRLDERDLSQRFGVSRTPLREALAQLDQEGLVKIVARRGIFIVRKTKAEVLDMITVWAALESMAARLATKHATAEELSALHGLVDQFSQDKVAAKMGEYSDANIKFHQAIISLGKNPLIAEITDGLFFHVRAIRQRTIFEQDRAKRSVVDHKDIVAALEARDTERAERLVREHTLRLRDHVERYVNLD